MNQIRFNHVFVVLVLLSILSAFVLPARWTMGMRGPVQAMFSPVSGPVHSLRSWGYGRLGGDAAVDQAAPAGPVRGQAQVYDENEQLRLAVASLSAQLDALKKLNADREALGDVRPLCSPAMVVGADAGQRESLLLRSAANVALRAGMPVLYSGGIAGRVEHAGSGAARVRLVTDHGFRATGSFGRFITQPDGRVEFVRIATHQPLVEGRGGGAMSVRNLPHEHVLTAGLTANDWVVLHDGDWPLNLDGYKLGRVVSIGPLAEAPGFAEIRIEPSRNLLRLREVMVMTQLAGY